MFFQPSLKLCVIMFYESEISMILLKQCQPMCLLAIVCYLVRVIFIIFSGATIVNASYKLIDSITLYLSWTYECIACQIDNFYATAESLKEAQEYSTTVPASLSECTMEVDDVCDGFEVTISPGIFNQTLDNSLTFNIPANSFSEYYKTCSVYYIMLIYYHRR